MNIINDARELALSKKVPARLLFEISEQKALELCQQFAKADKTVIHVGSV